MQVLESCQAKQQHVKLLFERCVTPEQKYEKIIELGRTLAPYPFAFKTSDYLVKGCQSVMYLHSQLINGKVHFQAYSEALISAGLVALLLLVYTDEPPEAILACSPRFLEELDIYHHLSPGRSNGLASLLQRMKKEALNFLIHSKN